MRGFSDYKTSALVLIGANALPIFGVLFLGWDTFSIVALYWVENVIIGAINVLKMITCSPDPKEIDWSKVGVRDESQLAEIKSQFTDSTSKAQLANNGAKLFLVPFFIVHYGFFCFIHGVFVFAVFGDNSFGLGRRPLEFGHHPTAFGPFGPLANINQVFTERHLWWSIIALAASHLWSFFVNFIGRGEYRRTAAPFLMFQPYARIFVMQFAIIIGAFISLALGSNAGILLILIVGKTLVDLSLHLHERKRNALFHSHQPPILPDVITGGTAGMLATPAASVQSRPPVRSSSGD